MRLSFFGEIKQPRYLVYAAVPAIAAATHAGAHRLRSGGIPHAACHHAPAAQPRTQGMDARAISYTASFQFIAMGIAPFTAGLIGSLLGLRAYFALTAALTFVAFGLWLRSEKRGTVKGAW